jgi:hypothetical protein
LSKKRLIKLQASTRRSGGCVESVKFEITTNLSKDQEQKLREAFGQA